MKSIRESQRSLAPISSSTTDALSELEDVGELEDVRLGATIVNRVASMAMIAVLLLALGACSHPSRFRPARTLDAKEIEASVGLQPASPVDLLGHYDRGTLIPFTPTFSLRYGLADWLELGGQLGGIHERVDLTLQVFETRFVDLALGLDLGLNFGSTVLFAYSDPGEAGGGRDFDFGDEKKTRRPFWPHRSRRRFFWG